jgi:hypothetical protein
LCVPYGGERKEGKKIKKAEERKKKRGENSEESKGNREEGGYTYCRLFFLVIRQVDKNIFV